MGFMVINFVSRAHTLTPVRFRSFTREKNARQQQQQNNNVIIELFTKKKRLRTINQ